MGTKKPLAGTRKAPQKRSKGGPRAELGEIKAWDKTDLNNKMAKILSQPSDPSRKLTFGHTCEIYNRYQPTTAPSLWPLIIACVLLGIFLDAIGAVDAMIEPLATVIRHIFF